MTKKTHTYMYKTQALNKYRFPSSHCKAIKQGARPAAVTSYMARGVRQLRLRVPPPLPRAGGTSERSTGPTRVPVRCLTAPVQTASGRRQKPRRPEPAQLGADTHSGAAAGGVGGPLTLRSAARFAAQREVIMSLLHAESRQPSEYKHREIEKK